MATAGTAPDGEHRDKPCCVDSLARRPGEPDRVADVEPPPWELDQDGGRPCQPKPVEGAVDAWWGTPRGPGGDRGPSARQLAASLRMLPRSAARAPASRETSATRLSCMCSVQQHTRPCVGGGAAVLQPLLTDAARDALGSSARSCSSYGRPAKEGSSARGSRQTMIGSKPAAMNSRASSRVSRPQSGSRRPHLATLRLRRARPIHFAKRTRSL